VAGQQISARGEQRAHPHGGAERGVAVRGGHTLQRVLPAVRIALRAAVLCCAATHRALIPHHYAR